MQTGDDNTHPCWLTNNFDQYPQRSTLNNGVDPTDSCPTHDAACCNWEEGQ